MIIFNSIMDLSKTKEFEEIIELAKKDQNIIALVLFGSYSRGDFKENSDLDLCVFRKSPEILPHEFELIKFQDRKTFDILFYDNLPDYIKYKIFQEGKILVLNDEITYSKIRRKFIHIYIDGYYFRQRQMAKLMERI